MSKIQGILLLGCTVLSIGSGKAADTLFQWPSVPDITNGDGLYLGLGAGLEYESEYDGSDQYEPNPEIVALAQWRDGNRVWFIDGVEAGLRANIDDKWLVLGGVRFEGGRESTDAPELAGLRDVDDEIVAIAEVRRALGSSGKTWVAARAQVGDSDIGALGVIAAGRTFAARERGMGIDLFAFTTFGTSAFVNRDFGIDATDSASTGLAQTDLKGGYRSLGLQATGRWRIGERWQIEVGAGIEQYNNDIGSSAITLADYEAEVGISAIYRIGRK